MLANEISIILKKILLIPYIFYKSLIYFKEHLLFLQISLNMFE